MAKLFKGESPEAKREYYVARCPGCEWEFYLQADNSEGARGHAGKMHKLDRPKCSSPKINR